jgi:hypothetical protein
MSEVQADGKTLKENLLNVQRQLKRTPKELENLVELPDCMQEYWNWFIRLSNHRPSGMGIFCFITIENAKALFAKFSFPVISSSVPSIKLYGDLRVPALPSPT